MTGLSKKIAYCWMILILSAMNKVSAEDIILPEAAIVEDVAQEKNLSNESPENTEVRAFHKPNG